MITLVATVHQPTERLTPMIATHLPALTGLYDAVIAYCSPETHPAIRNLLRRRGVRVQVNDGEPGDIHTIGQVRRRAVRAGLETGAAHLQMCDFDRAIHWAARYPDELARVIAALPDYDLLVLGRTARAWATHPPYQAETEPLFNKVFALATGLEWDVGAGSRGISRRAARRLLQLSQERTVGVDAEWPLLLLREPGFRVGYRACEGLEFETADRFGPEIEAAGGYAAWEAQISADPRQWAFRLEIAALIAQAVVRYGQPGGPTEHKSLRQTKTNRQDAKSAKETNERR
ncbi:MAG TPA: hypothetical protein ENJ31_06840 [Anaerolineae bacterium]|nr:hypothetical protein [Anaerolineae bacterium]